MRLCMGNEEFILCVRKQFPGGRLTNDLLGKKIWEEIRRLDPSAEIVVRDQPCLWGDSPEITSELTLPKTAAQFSFAIEILPAIYAFLGTLGR